MSFNDPFFTDPNYGKKTTRKFFIAMAIYALFFTIIISSIFTAIGEAGEEIERTGGLGNNIGRFLQDIKNPDQVPNN